MTVYAAGHAQLNYRVAGVSVHDGRVLLQRMETEDIWALPGGRPALFETSRDALVREMQEEIELQVEVGRLLWVMENVFTYDGRRIHELGFYYLMTLPEDSGLEDVRREYIGHEGELTLIFRWFPINSLAKLPLFPEFLRSALSDLPSSPVHLIHTDPVE
jgi:ADP-ribose pyrophosphatase YjhB (NUDIX family)